MHPSVRLSLTQRSIFLCFRAARALASSLSSQLSAAYTPLPVTAHVASMCLHS
jgi:hypothetical protein